MLSLYRQSRTYFHQITNVRRQLCAFTLTTPVQINVNHEVIRKLSVCIPLSGEFYSAHSKEKFLSAADSRHWTSQFYRLQSFSSSSGSGRLDESRQSDRRTRRFDQSERIARTVMVAGLSKDTTDDSLRQYFSKKGDVTNCQIIRDKMTGESRKFGFVEFATVEQAELASKSRPFIDDKNVSVRMSGHKELDEKYRIFVGGLSRHTSQAILQHHFSKFGDIHECHIVRNDDNFSKGFGFVIFKDQKSVDRALNSQPHILDSQVVTVEHTTPRRRELTLFIGNLSPKTTDESLREHFSKYGRLTQSEVKIDRQTGQSRGFGYVGFESQEELNGALNDQHVIDGVEVKLDCSTRELELQVDSLPQNMSEESLKKSLWDFFSGYGRVRDCRFIKNSVGTTTAFVSMSSKDEISRALAGRPHWINTIDKLVDTRHQGAEFGLIVRDLPKDATDEDLYKTFSKVGKLIHWQVMRDRKNGTNRPLGYGYVKFSTAEQVARAIENQPYEIKGTKLKIERRYDISKNER